MKLRFLTKWLFGLSILLLIAGRAQAQNFLYSTTVTPSSCSSISTQTTINLIPTGTEITGTCGANGTDIVLLNLQTVSSSPTPETVGPCNYTLTLTINGQSLTYTGTISGTASATTANVNVTINPTTEQIITVGCMRFHVTISTIVPPAPPQSTILGAIGAHVTCETCTTTLTKGEINACYPSIEAAQQAALDATTATNNCDGFVVTKTASNDGNLCPVTITVDANCSSGPVTYQAKIITAQPTFSGCPDNATFQCLSEVQPPANVTATDSCGAALDVSFSETGNNGTNCNNTITRTWTATDCLGQMATCTQTITVNDTTAPVLTGCPTDNPTVQCIGDVPTAPTVTATDNCDGDVTVVFSETQSNPGSSCNNTITRTWTAMDSCGNTASCSQTITVNDTTAPVISGCSDNLTVNGSGTPCQASVPLNITVSDNCDLNPTVTASVTLPDGTVVTLESLADPNNPGSFLFPQGTSTVTVTAVDICGNAATPCTFTVTVNCQGGATRTQGFWATHLAAAQLGLTNNCFPNTTCFVSPYTIGQVEAIFWAQIGKNCGVNRSALGQARLQLGQQLLAAYLNSCLLGTTPTTFSLADATAALNGTNVALIKSFISLADAFNNSGDNVPLTGGQQTLIGPATPQAAKAAATTVNGCIQPGDCFK